jgi:hypothetical protein
MLRRFHWFGFFGVARPKGNSQSGEESPHSKTAKPATDKAV